MRAFCLLLALLLCTPEQIFFLLILLKFGEVQKPQVYCSLHIQALYTRGITTGLTGVHTQDPPPASG